MNISEIQKSIKEIERELDKSSVFMLDCVDRTFLYLTDESDEKLKDSILKIDREEGYEEKMKNINDTYAFEFHEFCIKAKKISDGLFIGIWMCLKGEDREQRVEKAMKLINDIKAY